MALFHEPKAIVTGFKDRAESTVVFGNRLFIGTASGAINTYSLNVEGDITATLALTKSLSRKPIEQLAYIQDLNSLVVLTDATLGLYPLPDLGPPSPLTQARYVFSFAVNSSIEHVDLNKQHSPRNSFNELSEDIPYMLTRLVVGCRRRLVVFSWRDGEMQQLQETALSFSPRSIVFVNSSVVCLTNNTSEHFMFHLDTMSLSDIITLPTTNPTSTGIGSMSMGALTGLGGYMNLGLGSKVKPAVVSTEDGEILVKKDSNGFFLSPDGKSSKERLVDWQAPPEEVAYMRPYIISAMSTGSIAVNLNIPPSSNAMSQSTAIPSPVLQIRSSLSNKVLQNFAYPFTSSPVASSSQYIIRLLTTSSSLKGFLFAITSPTEKNMIASEGSTIWCFRLRGWSEQIDEYVKRKEYEDALALLHTLDAATLPDKDARIRQSSLLRAVSRFESGNHDSAIDTFIELDVNPAKVVALFPEAISGRLHTSKDLWSSMFGGPKMLFEDHAIVVEGKSSDISQSQSDRTIEIPEETKSVTNVPLTSSTVDEVQFVPGQIDDTDKLTPSVEALVRYLSDRRPKVKGALEANHIISADSHKFPFLSETSVEELMSIPDATPGSLTIKQMIRFAQIVDTALFKSYLIIRPKLLASLCRLDNWCEVSEVEEVLLSREKYPELMFLYNGKKMHGKALELLKSLSAKVNDKREKLVPTIAYLQNLGADYLDQIFDTSRWVFQQDSEMAFEIFTTEQRELPRSAVADFLEEIDPKQCAKYLEHCISEWGEDSTLIHDRLAELYLDLILVTKKQGRDIDNTDYEKFLNFINSSAALRADRLFGLLPRDDLYEARAILLGKLGKHESALETYVYRLHDYIKAEEYCKRVYRADSETKNIFLSLLKIYLQPPPQYSSNFLNAALELIRRQRSHLDVVETLQLLPPLVPAEDVKAILFDALRQPIFDAMILREIAKANSETVNRQLMKLESKRVLVTEDRVCPQCHKRIGNNSVIAVHTLRGEVTHYQCRENFSAKLTGRADN